MNRLPSLLIVLLGIAVGVIAALYVVPRYVPEIGKFYAAETVTCADAGYWYPNDVPESATCTSTGNVAPCCDKKQQWQGKLFENPSYCFVCDDGAIEGGSGGGGGGGGGGSCNTENMSASFSGGSVSIHNGNPVNCQVHVTSWRVYDRFMPEFLATQQLHDSAGPANVGPGQSITLNVNTADCSRQIDAGTGDVRSDPNYGGDYIDGRIIFTDFLCDGTCIDNCEHLACVSNSCQLVDGHGSNEDGCTTGGQACGVVPTHLECQNNACVTVNGAGNNACATNADCAAPTHLACQNNACVSVAGAGTNTCTTNADCAAAPTGTVAAVCDTPDVTRMSVSWTTTGTPTQNILQRSQDNGAYTTIFQENGPPFLRDAYADTQITLGHTYSYRLQIAPNVFSNIATVAANETTCNVPLTHKACANNACVVVNGAGTDTCSTNTDCTTPTHLACVNNACTAVAGAGTNSCATNADCAAPTHLECRNNACTSVSGAGTNLCGTNTDCAVATHLECRNNACTTVTGSGRNLCATNSDCAAPTHLECRNEACVTVNGSGSNECDSNSDCRPDALVCTPNSQDADVNETVEVRVSGGTSPYSWSTPGSSLLQMSGSRVSVRYDRAGSFPVAVSDSGGRSDVCYVNVQAPVTYIPPPPTYVPPPTYSPPPVTQVPTGPGETTVLALIVASIITLLYVGYTGTDTFRRRELKGNIDIARKDKDQFNFKK